MMRQHGEDVRLRGEEQELLRRPEVSVFRQLDAKYPGALEMDTEGRDGVDFRGRETYAE